MSQAARNRKKGIHQIEEQRQEILKAAERLFLKNGIANTAVIDIARTAGITKATLYRYFPNRDEIAIQIQIKMLEKMLTILDIDTSVLTMENTRRIVKNMIEKFDELQDILRFIEFFDQASLDDAYESPVSKEARDRVCQFFWGDGLGERAISRDRHYKQFIMLTNAVTFFCGSIALRKDLYRRAPGVEIPEIMSLFEDMLLKYIDTVTSEEKN